MAGATPEFEQAHDWATFLLIAGDPDKAEAVWTAPDEHTQRFAMALAGGWLKAILDLAETLGVEPGVLWKQARLGPLSPKDVSGG